MITGGAGTGERLSTHVRLPFVMRCLLVSIVHSCNSGTNLRKTLEKAWKWSKSQREVAKTIDASISEDTVRKWQKMVADYKQDKSKPNPFEEREIGAFFLPSVRLHLTSSAAVSFTSVRSEFLQEESDAQKRGAIQLHETTASAFLRQALDIEEKQYVHLQLEPMAPVSPVQRRVLRSRHRTASSSSVYQRESLQDQRRSLTHAIDNLRSPQRVYMPGCSTLLDDVDPELIIDAPESVKLWLPSALPSISRDTWCTSGLPVLEFRLRYAQAADALDHLRRLRRLVRGLVLQAKKHPSPTQRTMTRSQSVWEGLDVRVAQVSARYRDARTALLRLHPSGGWAKFFLELKKEDVRGPAREEDDPSESRFIPSWIWTLRAPQTPPDLPGSPPSTTTTDLAQTSPPINGSASNSVNSINVSTEEVEEYMLVDWARAQERAKRFEEEVELCAEEMRRTLSFFSWSASEWDKRAEERANSKNPPSDNVLQGLRAYAHRRSAMFRDMIKVFVNDWHSSLQPKGLGGEWLARYSTLITPQRGRNTIPSIIPLIPEDNFKDDILSDQDEPLEPLADVTTEQEAGSQLREDFLQIMADG